MSGFFAFFTDSAPPWMWISLIASIAGFIFGDLYWHRGHHGDSQKSAWFWVLMSLAFFGLFTGFVVYPHFGPDETMKISTAYAMEMALSVDNLFVIMAIMTGFGLNQPKLKHNQHRILLWGVLGAVVFRLIILGSLSAIMRWTAAEIWGVEVNFMFLACGLLLVYMGLKWAVGKFFGGAEAEDDAFDPASHVVVRTLSRWLPIDATMEHGKFFTKLGATPLFLCLMTVEAMDLVFAVDSIPVVLGIVQKNMFGVIYATMSAVLCLRSLYFVLDGLKDRLWALEPAVAVLLCIIGIKMALGAVGFHTPIIYGLGSVVILLGGSILISVLKPKSMEEVTGRGRRILVRTRNLKFADDLYSN